MHLSVNVGNTVLACPTFGHRIDSVLTENQFLDSSLDPGIHMSCMYTQAVCVSSIVKEEIRSAMGVWRLIFGLAQLKLVPISPLWELF